jgi:hypothetical protein
MNKFKTHIIRLFLVSAMLTIGFACGDKNGENGENIIDNVYKPIAVTPVSGLRIAWDYSTLTKMYDKGASPKAIRAADGTLVAVYAADNNIYLVRSSNGGISWTGNTLLFEKTSHTGKNGNDDISFSEFMMQPTITQLANGDFIAACAVKYQYTLTTTAPPTVVDFPAAVKVRRITGSTTLEPVKEVYANLGCESPAFLQLPDGNLQLYFANGAVPQTVSILNSTNMATAITEQDVVLLTSADDGRSWSSSIKDFGPDGVDRSWSGAKEVASRFNAVNKYPSPVLLGNQIVVALADNKAMTFKPYTVRTPLVANWSIPVKGDTPDREYALYELLPDKYLMNATTMLVLPQGKTLLSYESDEMRNKDFEIMEVAVGDADARNFKHRTRPFPFPDTEKAISNSIMLLDETTVMAFTTSNRGTTTATTVAPWSVKGYFIDDIALTGSQISDYPLFVGSKTEAGIRAGLGIDASNLYVKVTAKDATPIDAPAGSQHGDGIYLYIDAANLSLLDVDAGIYKFWVSSTGSITRWDGKEGIWVDVPADGLTVNAQKTTDGYTLDIALSRAKLSGFNDKGIRFAIGLSNFTTPTLGITELLSLCQDLRSASWIGIVF